MTAHSEIQMTLNRMAWASDHSDAEMARACMIEDFAQTTESPTGEVTTLEGREQALAAWSKHWAGRESAGKHVVGNAFVVRETETEAEVCSYITVVRIPSDTGEPFITSTAECRDVLVSDDGTWRIKRRHQTNAGRRTRP